MSRHVTVDVEAVVVKTISELLLVSNPILLTDRMSVDLGMDSLDAVTIAMSLEEEFDITVGESEFYSLSTVGEVVDHVINRMKSESSAS